MPALPTGGGVGGFTVIVSRRSAVERPPTTLKVVRGSFDRPQPSGASAAQDDGGSFFDRAALENIMTASILEAFPSQPQSHAISLPAKTFTGDFWFTHRTPDRLWFALGDVAGKGLPAAIVMAMIQEELEHRIASCARAGCDPATTMRRLDQFLKPLLPSNRFATAVIGWLDNDGTMALVNAGHCPPLIVRANGQIEEIDSTGPVAGIVPNSRWHSTTIDLAPGDLVVLYSDGVIESADGDDFGIDGIQSALPPSTCPRIVAAAIVEAATRHRGETRYDDLTVMVIAAG